ncbi:MAG: hypothetical protein HY959_00545 [Ignavibacteriae bacterium]|nr:hypothetical protein [Ignavibacteriota bacterium]
MEKIHLENYNKSADSETTFNGIDLVPVSEMKKWYRIMEEFGREILKVNIDYGLILGTKKPALLKPGAEKIRRAFNLQVERLDCIKETVDVQKGFIDYTYKCVITSKTGVKLGICDGNANSKEAKFRYVFKPASGIPDRKKIGILKAEGLGKWKKSEDKWVWMERKENPEVLSLKNIIQKVAQKRAFVGAVLMASGTSEFFTQDAAVN